MISLLVKIFVNCAKIFGKNYEPGLLALRLGVELLEQLGDDADHVLDDLLVLLGVLHPDLHRVLHLRRGVHRAHHRRDTRLHSLTNVDKNFLHIKIFSYSEKLISFTEKYFSKNTFVQIYLPCAGEQRG